MKCLEFSEFLHREFTMLSESRLPHSEWTHLEVSPEAGNTAGKKGRGGKRHGHSSRSPPDRGAVTVVYKKGCAPGTLSGDVPPLSLIPPCFSWAWWG